MPDIVEGVERGVSAVVEPIQVPVRGQSSGRKPRPAMPIDESRAEQIVRVAGLLFRSRGYENTTMRDIAEAADLTPGALYWHFPSKEEILYQHLLTWEQPWYDSAHLASLEGTPDQQLLAFVRAFVQYQLDHPCFELGWGAMARTGQLAWRLPVEQREIFRTMDRNMVLDLEGILTRGIKAGIFREVDIRLTASGIINMCSILGAWILPSGDVDFPSAPDTYANLVLHMVASDQQ